MYLHVIHTLKYLFTDDTFCLILFGITLVIGLFLWIKFVCKITKMKG